MATIKITPDEFTDYIIAFLLDKIMDDDESMVGNEEFNEIIKKMKLSGMEPFLLRYFIRSSVILRSKYKSSKEIFNKNGKIDKSVINIQKDLNKKNDTNSVADKIKKALKMVKDEKVKRNRPFLTESQIDSIINRVIEDE